jgi:hypothetical protein
VVSPAALRAFGKSGWIMVKTKVPFGFKDSLTPLMKFSSFLM